MPTAQIQGLTVGLFLLILSGIIFSGMAGMESAVTYANVSPKAFPYGVGSAIFILALLLILQTLRGHFPHPPEGTDKAFDLWRTAVLLVVYIGGVALFEILGFVIVCTILFCRHMQRGRRRQQVDIHYLRTDTFSGYVLAFYNVSQRYTARFSADTPYNLLFGFIGCLLGTLMGILPGIGPGVTIALLLPFTGFVPAETSLITFAGIYYGSQFGGSTTSILANVPGETASHPPALATAAIGSFVAGILTAVVMIFWAPLVADWAVLFGPAEYFSLMLFAFFTTCVLLGRSAVLGFISLFAGLTIGLIGLDNQTGQARFAYGQLPLLDGIDLSVVAQYLTEIRFKKGLYWMNKEDWKRSWPAWLRGFAIGLPFGCIPAGGAEIPTILSYAAEKKLSKKPEEFGHGAIEGVAGPESANNASSTASLIPLLTLGLPTSVTAAMMLLALQRYGLKPGPLLFEQQTNLVWGIFASLITGNIILLILNLPLVGIWVKFLDIPKKYIYGGIIIFSLVSVYSMNSSAFDLGLLIFFGLLGFVCGVRETGRCFSPSPSVPSY
ncbi:hypothetical protein CHS0354_006933 [Potamilus streckersoni]|uniref:Tripartite tricarboxylate transporter TctA family protein n=1 Tax=Potamilus streckersoni TaxID=2493646 RepID=A0AAE0TEF8_9BIVA|nr:hypothetical protein CHS0354_006933 [Potamilus streckersoni]